MLLGNTKDSELIVDINNLTTHCLIIGMTGSGKTGLVLNQAIQLINKHIPLIIFDLKGDLIHLTTLNTPEYPISAYVPDIECLHPSTDMLFKGGLETPGATIIYLSHLSTDERLKVIEGLLNDLEGYIKTQGGSSILRGAIIMDEIYGLIPPVKKSPIKMQLLSLLKQSRGFGYGFILATQNPGDLDYRALSNIGMWGIGKLLTLRDRSKVAEGLENKEYAELLKNLKQREFFFRSIYLPSGYELFTTVDCAVPLLGPMTFVNALRLVPDNFRTYYKLGFIQSRVGAVKSNFLRDCIEQVLEAENKALEELHAEYASESSTLHLQYQKLIGKLKLEREKASDRKLATITSGITAFITTLTGKAFTTSASRIGSTIRNANKTKSTQERIDELTTQILEIKEKLADLKQKTTNTAEIIRTKYALNETNLHREVLWHELNI